MKFKTYTYSGTSFPDPKGEFFEIAGQFRTKSTRPMKIREQVEFNLILKHNITSEQLWKFDYKELTK